MIKQCNFWQKNFDVTYCVLTYCIQMFRIIVEVVWLMDIISVFANNVKKYRKKKGLSQEAFAEKAGLHRTYISAIEREKRSISLDNVQKIANALEIETYLLFIVETEEKKGGLLKNENL